MRIDSSPVYLDTSALAKIYVVEPGSALLEAALRGRRDLLVSDLAVTELTSALARRVRGRDLSSADCGRVYRGLLADLKGGQYRWVEATREVHRAAERLLLVLGRQVPLRAGDALHLALAHAAGARALVTFDARMRTAAEAGAALTVAP